MRQKLHEQELDMQTMRQDTAFENQRRDSEVQHKTEDVAKRKDLKSEMLQSELTQVKQMAVFDLEKERAEYERQMQVQAPVYSEAPQINPYNTPPVARWAATAQVPAAVVQVSPALLLGASASNVRNLQTRRRTRMSRTKQYSAYAGHGTCPPTYAK